MKWLFVPAAAAFGLAVASPAPATFQAQTATLFELTSTNGGALASVQLAQSNPQERHRERRGREGQGSQQSGQSGQQGGQGGGQQGGSRRGGQGAQGGGQQGSQGGQHGGGYRGSGQGYQGGGRQGGQQGGGTAGQRLHDFGRQIQENRRDLRRERREDRRDFRRDRRDHRRDFRQERRRDRFDWRDYRPGRRPPDWERYRHFDRSFYQRNFRSDRRYRWHGYRRPPGWYYRRWEFGMMLPFFFWTRDYWIGEYWDFGLMDPPYGYVWVRYGNDALLVNVETGYILRVVYDVFY